MVAQRAPGPQRGADVTPSAVMSTSPRVHGVDLARGIAVLGMFVAHLSLTDAAGDRVPPWFVVFDGRSSALFAFLAGVSIGLMSGGAGRPGAQAVGRARVVVAVRAAVLFPLGYLLVALGTPVLVILPAYAAMFLLVLPVVGWRPRALVALAAAVLLVMPAVRAVLTVPATLGGRSPLGRLVDVADPAELPGDVLLTGHYPALLWVAYLLVGLAATRSDLTARRTQGVLVGAGAALTVVGYQVSARGLDALDAGAGPLARALLRAEPHDYSTPEMVGNLGVAMAVLGVCVAATDRSTALARAATAVTAPVRAVGAMALTVYCVHVVAIFVLGDDVVWEPVSNAVLGWFVLVALAAAWAWQRWVGRGPLEELLRAAGRVVAGPAQVR